MEKEKTRGRTRRKQPSQVAGFLYREGRKWCAAALSLCMILNNMASVTWAAESVREKEVLFKLTSRSLYEALQEAVREETMADDHFLFEGKEKDVEAYEKLLLLDDDLYELKPQFENKDEVTEAEKKNDLQLRIFASLGWETDPEREYQVVGDEKIIFCLSNASETEQTAVIQVDEKTTEEIVLVPGSAVVVDSKGGEEILETEGGDESKEDGKEDETENGESEGQAEEENNSEGIKEVGGNSGAGGASGGNGGNSGNGSNGGNGSNSSDSSEREDIVESGSSAEGEDFAESEGTVESETSAKNEGSAGNESSVGTENSAENEGKADESAADAEENRNDETQEKADAEGEDKESKDSQETVNKPETGNSQGNTKEPENTSTQENTNTQDKAEEKDERKDEEVKNNPASEKEETEKPDKTEAGSNESGKPDKAESGNAENGKADKPDKTDKSDNKESSKPETSEKSESGNTSTGKGEKTDTEKAGSDRSGNSDSSKKSESSKDSSNSGSSDNSSDKGKEVSVGISRNVICLVADNLEVSASDDVEETESTKETTIIATQEKQKEEVIEEELEEVKAKIASSSDVEDDEIEGELHAPVVVNEESIIVFVTTAEELGLNRAELRKASDSNAKHISPAYEGEVELENVIVQVKADENVLPEGVKLQVKEIKQEGEDVAQYEEAKEALDSQGTEYDGMMALDISFLDKKGREIEPDGNVQVSIKVKKEALPEEADLESIAVQHLVEDEGEIFVEEVADCGNKTRGNVKVEAEEHVEAAFEVDSFSVFTVTVKWVIDGNDEAAEAAAQLTLNFYSEDESGNKQLLEESRIKIDKTMQLSDSMAQINLKECFENSVDGYSEYLKAEFSVNYYETIVQYGIVTPKRENNKFIMAFKEGEATSIEIGQGNVAFSYKIVIHNQSETGAELEGYPYELWGWGSPVNNLTVADEDHQGALGISLNLYYKRDSSDLGILNTVKKNGLLTADKELEEGQHYVWYKWQRGLGVEPQPSDRVEVERKQITGNKWNMDESKRSINVALDGGSQKYYQVEIIDENGVVVSSQPCLIDYYDKLENGSFQNPKITDLSHEWKRNGTDSLIWKSTTGTVELVQDKSTDHNLHIYQGGMHGSQCAELNSDMSGSLYQDVLTVPGTTLHWSLLHRARGPYLPSDPSKIPEKDLKTEYLDTMYVLIMPTLMAEELFGKAEVSQEELVETMKKIQGEPDKYPGASISPALTSNNQGWYRKGGDYTVGDEQCLTRFFFIAGATGSNDPTRGNLLDDVWFGTELPPVSVEQGNLWISKVVKGLSEEDIQGYELKVKVTSFTGADLSTSEVFESNGDGTYSAEVSLIGFQPRNDVYFSEQGFSYLPAGTYEIEEILPDGFPQPNISIEEVTLGENNEIIATTNITNGKVTLEKGKTTYVRLTNMYPEKLKGSFSIKKIFQNGVKKQDSIKESFKNVQFKLESVDNEKSYTQTASMAMKDGASDTEDNKLSVDENNSDNLFGSFIFENIPEGIYRLTEFNTPDSYQTISPVDIYVGKVTQTVMENGEAVEKEVFGCYVIDTENPDDKTLIDDNGLNVENKEIPSGAILPDTGGPGLAMFERYGWFLLMLALLMAGVEVRCYGEWKYRRVPVGQHEEFEDPI